MNFLGVDGGQSGTLALLGEGAARVIGRSHDGSKHEQSPSMNILGGNYGQSRTLALFSQIEPFVNSIIVPTQRLTR